MQQPASQQSLCVDLVLCIDCTASMTDLIEAVKGVALTLDARISERLGVRGLLVDELRVRVVGFRDARDHGQRAVEACNFLVLPDQREAFEAFVRGLELLPGNTHPESGLLGLAAALASEFTRNGSKRRHVIVVWADEPPHPLESEPDIGSATVPRTFDALTDMWDESQTGLTYGSKRLILFAPDAGEWSRISEYWDNVIHRPSRAGTGISEAEFIQMLDTVAASI